MLDLLNQVQPAYEKLGEILIHADLYNFCSSDALSSYLAAWKMLMLLDCRISKVDAAGLCLSVFPEDHSHETWMCAFGSLPGMIDSVREACLLALGFESSDYDLELFDEELSGMGYGDPERTMEFVDYILEGDVFEKDTVYLSDFSSFVMSTEGCGDFDYVGVKLYKNAWLGRLIEEANAYGLSHEACYTNMLFSLSNAFGGFDLISGQSGSGVERGVYYAYLTLYDYKNLEDNFTWCDVPPIMIMEVNRAIYYAKELEKLLDHTKQSKKISGQEGRNDSKKIA